jgi:cytochrome-b5 reductase
MSQAPLPASLLLMLLTRGHGFMLSRALSARGGDLTGAVMEADEPLEYASSCYLPTTWTRLPLISKKEYNADSTLYDFGLPEDKSLNLPACGCILLLAPGAETDGSDAVRPYTPISPNEVTGSFQLLVKRYPDGRVSQYLHNLEVGAEVAFKHIIFNVKRQYPFEPAKTISLLCAGTGIAPIYQALLRLMNTPGDNRKVVLLYGNKSPDDILLKDELDGFARQHPDRLQIVHVVGETPDAPAPAGWESTETFTAETGWIDSAKIQRYCFPPAPETAIFVCGLPIMYDLWCGPRSENEIAEGTVLQKLGYTSEMVAKM